MFHVEIANGLSTNQATAFEARLREARITYLRQEAALLPRDPFAGSRAPFEFEREPCARFLVRRECAQAARAILLNLLEEAYS